INNLNNISIIAPTHYIEIDNDLVNFKPFEFISQNVNGVVSLARFIHFDLLNRRLYLLRVTDNGFLSLSENDLAKIATEEQQDAILYERLPLNDPDSNGFKNKQYFITGLESNFEAMPLINSIERSYRNTSVNLENINLKNAFLLVEYIFLDQE